MTTPAIVWFRHDLRLTDHAALWAAVKRGGAVIPLFVWAPGEEGAWPPGAVSCWWLHQSLTRLAEDLRARGNALIIRNGPSRIALMEVARASGATAVYWSRRYEPAVVARDRALEDVLREAGLEVESFEGAVLHDPGEIRNKSGNPFQVFTPFWRACLARPEPDPPLPPAPERLSAVASVDSLPLGALALEPKVNWASGLAATWRPGSAGAGLELARFVSDGLEEYPERRNLPGQMGTSRLSPHLHFGEVSPREVWHAVRRRAASRAAWAAGWRGSQFIAELGWREFAHHLLFHFQRTPEEPLRPEFKRFPWRRNRDWLRAWERGWTGFPFVDAGMRELWGTGWMHNRVRMVVASFLVKNLMIRWQDGARWFWDTLVDADLANNTLGWQWSAGCGADAAPYFRIFNPVSQSERFDPSGSYIRRWIPELSALDNRWIHRPWEAPEELLKRAGIELGRDYPTPIVSHAIAREIALEAYGRLRGGIR
jgi:deoxyribodipyrimidine photo-lyase